jgi:hypothetical protein
MSETAVHPIALGLRVLEPSSSLARWPGLQSTAKDQDADFLSLELALRMSTVGQWSRSSLPVWAAAQGDGPGSAPGAALADALDHRRCLLVIDDVCKHGDPALFLRRGPKG